MGAFIMIVYEATKELFVKDVIENNIANRIVSNIPAAANRGNNLSIAFFMAQSYAIRFSLNLQALPF